MCFFLHHHHRHYYYYYYYGCYCYAHIYIIHYVCLAHSVCALHGHEMEMKLGVEPRRARSSRLFLSWRWSVFVRYWNSFIKCAFQGLALISQSESPGFHAHITILSFCFFASMFVPICWIIISLLADAIWKFVLFFSVFYHLGIL